MLSAKHNTRPFCLTYNEKCRGDSSATKQPEPTGHHFEIFLPESLNATVAAAGAEGVYGVSTLAPWEAATMRSAKKLAVPVAVVGLMALGVYQMIQTGNTATLQRAWAMAR